MIGNASELLGKTADDPKLTAVLRDLNEKPVVTFEDDSDIANSMYYELKGSGVSLNFDRQRKVNSVFLYGNGYQGFSTCKLPLPEDLSFRMSRSQTRARLGLPAESGGPCEEIVGRGRSVWDRWLFPGWYLHVQFPESESSISLVTLIALEALS